ncbi:hypothetical protein HF1_05080 [Mycoplasma haemofelis str. Langford 1]|uniref:Lipoprotein n=1 Tax=Mycoplasma haemofelis (strain Langford 1) TaxID=941640 RepID=E8ZH95_MYCHL|nr:hypothetical protein [Mycoplasma haemofelis]CBY92516.1 hypothetical protein HF1_05080 [Mycoplasma haemofelis str. Langford 1]
MGTLATKAIAGLGAAGVTGTAAAGVWYINQPKDVKSKLVSEGLTLVGDSSRAWRAVFLTHKDDKDFVQFAGIESNQASNSEGSKVSSACAKALKVESSSKEYDSSLEKARKYCTVPEFKTVEAKVLFSDKEISSEDRDWKNLFTIHKEDASFIDKVKKASSDDSITSSSQAESVKSKVQKFCDDLKVKTPNSENLSDYEKYCLQTAPNARSFYEGKGRRFVGSGEWGGKFDAIKASDSALFTAIQNGETLNNNSPAETGGPKLQAWCDKEVVKEIHAVDPKTKDRCFN